jgi:spore maturation protein SpmA
MLNGLWLGLILISILLGGFTGRLEAVTQGAFSAAKDAITVVALPLAGLMGLWLGLLRLAELSGLVESLARKLHPLMRVLFPEVPVGHPAMGAMVLNMAANMLGLGNAATPLGLRAMRCLETLNPHPGVATNAMCTFLAINTSSIQLVPATAIAILAAQGSKQPTAILATALLASATAATVGILAVKFLQRLPTFRIRPEDFTHAPVAQPTSVAGTSETEPQEVLTSPPKPLTSPSFALLALYCGLFLLLAALLLFPAWFSHAFDILHRWSAFFSNFAPPPLPEAIQNQVGLPKFLGVLSLLAVPFLIGFFVLYAAVRGVKVYEEFVNGAKEGWQVALRIIPYLTAILVGIRMFREAGAVELVAQVLAPVLQPLGVSADLLPLILVRPLSGGATTGLFTELVTRFGPDSLIARTAATIFGSTETTFYVLAVYFGAVGIRKGRHALATGLIADATGAIASIAICRWMFA